MPLDINQFTQNIASPARLYIWEVVIPGVIDAGFRAQTSQFPSVGSTDIDLFYQGETVKFAGAPEYEHIWTCEFAEGEDGAIYNALYDWRQQIWSQTEFSQQAPAVYKRDIQVNCLKSSDSTPWVSAVLHGCYPKTIDALALDRSANTEAVKWSVQFSFDNWNKV